MNRIGLSHAFSIALLFFGWLLPNHELPWPSAFGDACAIAGVFVLSTLAMARATRVDWPAPALVALGIAVVPMAQHLAGRVTYLSDAVMPTLYLALFALSVVSGRSLVDRFGIEPLARVVAVCAVACAILSVGLAAYQWLSLSGLDIFAADLPPGSQPFANVAQPNHLATLLTMGCVLALVLRRLGAIGNATLALTLAWLLTGVVMTRSRTGFLEVAVVAVLLLLLRKKRFPFLSATAIVATFLAFAALQLAWPHLADLLQLSPARNLQKQLEGGTRWTHWHLMLAALAEKPWFGFGWNQVSVAQHSAVLAGPAPHELVEHSHTIVLDMLVWNGLPLGLLILLATAVWFVSVFRRSVDPIATLLLATCAVVVVHGLLEYPLEYAYFLLPVGFMVGMVCTPRRSTSLRQTSRWPVAALLAPVAALTAFVAVEYLVVKENLTTLRFEQARIGTGVMTSRTPQLRLLTAQAAFLDFARATARPGMTEQELLAMEQVARRFAFSSILFRHGLANALNGRPAESAASLVRLCKLHPRTACEQARESWQSMTSTYPDLVPFPDVSGIWPKPSQ